MTETPRIEIAKCAECWNAISRLVNDDIWLHNMPDSTHMPEPAPGTIRDLYAYPGLGYAQPSP